MLIPAQLAVHFINRKAGISITTPIEVGFYGDLLNTPDGFDDFFSDDMLETAERMRARLSGFRKET
jgi:predicted ATPase